MKYKVLDAIRVVSFALLFSAALLGLAKLGDYTRPAQAQFNNSQYPAGAIPVVNSAAGTTGAVVATLPASPGRLNWVCGLQVSAAGTATVSPVTVANVQGGSIIYQGITAGAVPFTPNPFVPCLPASAVNTAITVTTTANGTATAVNVSAWGYQTLQ